MWGPYRKVKTIEEEDGVERETCTLSWRGNSKKEVGMFNFLKIHKKLRNLLKNIDYSHNEINNMKHKLKDDYQKKALK